VQQALLDPQPDARLRVYAVWFAMYPDDARDQWRARLLPDERVAHFWDEPRSVGTLLFRNLPGFWEKRAAETKQPVDGVLWDSWLLFGPDARWDDEAPPLVSWGYTILMTRTRLERDFHRILGLSAGG